MNMMRKMKKAMQGVGMIEILVGIVISSLLTIAVITVYMSQNVMFKQQSSRNFAAADTWDVYSLVAGIMRHAQINGFDIDYGVGELNSDDPFEIELLDDDFAVQNDEITINFSVPTGMSIWPNDVAPFDRNIMRMTWRNNGTDSFRIEIATDNGAGFSDPVILAGGNEGGNTRIINFDVWPMSAQGQRQPNVDSPPIGGYQVVISTRAAMQNGNSDPVFTVSGIVLPRNR